MIELEVTKNGFRELAAGMKPRTQAAVIETTRELQVELGKRYPRIKPHLRRHTSRLEGQVTGPWWWIFPNYGTRYQAARGFAQQSTTALRDSFERRLRKAITGE